MNILYNNIGIYLSKRIQVQKEMYNMWQAPGGKIERGESSVQVAIRETEEEIGIQLSEKDLIYLFNDPTYNCDVYITKVYSNQKPKHTEPEKQGPWKHISFEQYEKMAKQKLTTPTHTSYIQEIMKSLLAEESAYTQYTEEIQDALFGEAEVYGEKINILIDSGAVGCIISKRFLDRVQHPIDALTNVKIIDITGKRTSPLGIV